MTDQGEQLEQSLVNGLPAPEAWAGTMDIVDTEKRPILVQIAAIGG